MNHQNHRLNSRDSEYQVDLMEVTLEKELVKVMTDAMIFAPK